ncbi:sugar transferase [Halococcus dombrowskii]|uniref:Sugar transferase n=1 Tax=Halococcus dombrowskii TaxID=179637 RepID=A0AAV3SH28_HALDO|nr:sugar transferase [Halococcus dombrowskii]UOO94855.1 sugar transferase [Halococcus dombrowskii]
MDPNTGWRYRVASSFGASVLVVCAIAVANYPFVQRLVTTIPLLDRLPVTVLSGGALVVAMATALAVLAAALLTLFKPHPRRILDTISLTLRRLFMGALALAAIGYFDYTYRLPRTTLVVTTLLLSVALPAWFVAIRRRPEPTAERAVLVGDDPDAMGELLATTDLPIVGYIAPAIRYDADRNRPSMGVADGGQALDGRLDEIDHLGGLSRLDDLLIEHDIDTAVLAFERSDRAAFFGALATCYNHGVTAKVHRKHADSVLTSGTGVGELIDTELVPWDWQDRIIKRGFDIAFALAGLVALSPIIIAIAAAIKLDDGGPLFYGQERTAEFGETFQVYKFRSMIPDAEAATGAKLSEEDAGGVDPRVTRIGRLLRRTHLDEIPQLWSIFAGDMSVVGPRPERPELDDDIETNLIEWRRRWFVKPGLTGLAQINEVTGYDPERKLQYDVKYINERSFWFDLQIVVRQVWLVLSDLAETVSSR